MWGDAGTSPEHRDVLGCQGNTITPDNTDVSSKLHARRIPKQTNKAFCFPLVIKPMVWVTVAKVWLGVLLHVIRPGKPRAWLMPRKQPSWLYPCNFLPQAKSKNGQQKNKVKMQGRILLLNVAVSSKCRQLSQYTNYYSLSFFFHEFMQLFAFTGLDSCCAHPPRTFKACCLTSAQAHCLLRRADWLQDPRSATNAQRFMCATEPRTRWTCFACVPCPWVHKTKKLKSHRWLKRKYYNF